MRNEGRPASRVDDCPVAVCDKKKSRHRPRAKGVTIMSATLHATPNAFRNFRILTALFVSIILLLTPTAGRVGNTASQSDTLSGTVQATAENSPGLRETKFSTPAGTLTLYLSDEMAPGDSLTGTVVAQPSGKNDTEREKNRSALENFAVNVGGNLISAAQKKFQLQIPADGTKKALEVALRDNKGRELSRLDAPILEEAPRNAPAEFELPSLVQQGRPGLIRGPFDGDISDTDRVTLAGQPMNQLVQTQRSAVFSNTSGAVGAAPLEINEQRRVVTGEVQSVAVSLSATTLTLQNGQTTPISVQVTGLRPGQAVSLSLKNLSPDVITLAGGNSQTINIAPPDVQPGGTFKTERLATGVKPGGFSITATVVAPANQRGERATAAGRPAEPGPAGQDTAQFGGRPAQATTGTPTNTQAAQPAPQDSPQPAPAQFGIGVTAHCRCRVLTSSGFEVASQAKGGFIQPFQVNKCTDYCRGMWDGASDDAKKAWASLSPNACGNIQLRMEAKLGTMDPREARGLTTISLGGSLVTECICPTGQTLSRGNNYCITSTGIILPVPDQVLQGGYLIQGGLLYLINGPPCCRTYCRR
jgi:hypothetical protein